MRSLLWWGGGWQIHSLIPAASNERRHGTAKKHWQREQLMRAQAQGVEKDWRRKTQVHARMQVRAVSLGEELNMGLTRCVFVVS